MTDVAILIKNNISFKEVFLNNVVDGMQVCAAEIFVSKNLSINCVSVYCPPNVSVTVHNFSNLFNDINGTSIIGGDFNAHHDLWGSYKINQSVKNMVNALNQNNLVILNDGPPTKISRSGQNSSVDLTLVSPDIADKTNWTVVIDTLGSDHFLILLKLSILREQFSNTIQPKTKWNTRKANWMEYERMCILYFSNKPQLLNVNDKYKYFMEGIEYAATCSIPINKPCKRAKLSPPPWWDDECDKVVRYRKEALNNYINNSNIENYIQVKEKMATSKKFLKNKAKSYWINYYAKLNKNTPSKEIWQQAKKMQRIPAPKPKCSNYDWIETFLQNITPCSADQEVKDLIDNTDVQNDIFNYPLKFTELQFALKSTSNTAPGMDQVTYDMLWNLPTVEAIGIIKACDYVEKKNKLKKIHFLSDSLSVLKCIANPINVMATDTNPFIRELKARIHKLKKSQYELKFTWVKAHIGLRGNEVADSLAKESVTTGEHINNNLGGQEY
ncbi:uncharacterized protein [Diabrotica undecimpunctata]|uniref:uncharacterized protein n=1 Tax=Diabrotica undecimpunctata TaxID=50387 RepID=UPI003B63DB56